MGGVTVGVVQRHDGLGPACDGPSDDAPQETADARVLLSLQLSDGLVLMAVRDDDPAGDDADAHLAGVPRRAVRRTRSTPDGCGAGPW